MGAINGILIGVYAVVPADPMSFCIHSGGENAVWTLVSATFFLQQNACVSAWVCAEFKLVCFVFFHSQFLNE